MNDQHDLLAYLNGRFLPHRQVVAELQGAGGQSAGGFYDTERTFCGKVFKLRNHLQRLYNGLNYSQIDSGLSLEEMEEATLFLLQENAPRLRPGQEFTITQIVSLTHSGPESERPDVTTVIYFQSLDFSAFAHSYTQGVRLITPATYGVPDEEADAKRGGAQVFPLMTSNEGSITECKGANFMFVQDGRIKLPDRSNVLPGVSMHTLLELAASLGILVDEGDYSTYDVYSADEAFVSSTRYCMLPVASINGYRFSGSLPGPVTAKLMASWRELVGIDFVQQALDNVERSSSP